MLFTSCRCIIFIMGTTPFTTPILRRYYASTTPTLRRFCTPSAAFSFLGLLPPVTREQTVGLCTTPILRRYYAVFTTSFSQSRGGGEIGTTPFTTPILRRYYAGTTSILRRHCAQNLHPCWGFLRLPRLVKMGCRNITNDTFFVKAGVYKIFHIYIYTYI